MNGSEAPKPLNALLDAVQQSDRDDLARAWERGRDGGWCDCQFRLDVPDGAADGDGTSRVVRLAGRPLWDSGDRSGPPDGMIATVRDVTAEVAAARFTALLAEVLERTEDFISVASATGIVEFVNRAGRQMVKMTDGDGDGAGRPIADFHPPEEYRRIRDEALPAAARDGHWAGRTTLQRLDGETVPVLQSVTSHRDVRTER